MPVKPLGHYRGPLDPAQIADGINVAARNACRLCEDAEFLLERSRHATAAALAILSIEESGKVSILRHLSVSTQDQDIKDRWREYRSHTKKNVMGGLLEQVAKGARKLHEFRDLFAEDAEHPQILDQLKQVSIYSDCLGNAHWSEPSQVIDGALAAQLVQTARVLVSAKHTTEKEIELWVKHLGPVWNRNPDWMRQALQNWYGEMQKAGLVPPGPNAMSVFINEGVGPRRSGG